MLIWATDVFVTLNDRVTFANSNHANLFVSIHGNSWTPQSTGTETFYYNHYSAAFTHVLHKNLLAATGFADGGVKVGNFRVINGTNMPAGTVNSKKKLDIQAYYADEEGAQLAAKTVSIEFAKDTDKYLASLNQLQEKQEKPLIPLLAGFTFAKPVFKDGLLTVDLSKGANSQLGAQGEILVLEAIQKTLFQFPEVEAIEILSEGKQVESLMGHVELSHPIKRK